MTKRNYFIGLVVSLVAFVFVTHEATAQTPTFQIVTPTFNCLTSTPCTTPDPTALPTGINGATGIPGATGMPGGTYPTIPGSSNSPTIAPCTSQAVSINNNKGGKKHHHKKKKKGGIGRFIEFLLQLLIQLLERAGIIVPPSLTNPCTTIPTDITPVATYPASTINPVITSGTVTTYPTTGQITASCTPAGIGALSDQLVTELRKACTSEGAGIISRSNYTCMKATLEKILPNGSQAYQQAYQEMFQYQHNYYQCVNFTATVARAACGQRISAPEPGNAKDYSGHSPSGYKWMNKTSGQIQVGDIPVYTGGQFGHIMVVAEVLDANHVRIAEANQASEGEVSNNRIETVDNSVMTGWIRKL